MLITLRLQNIVLFGTKEIDFYKGFTAFTGETGSGKSVFIDTLNALLVNKKSTLNNLLVKSHSNFSLIEGVFSLSKPIQDWLISQELDFSEDLVVTREWRFKENKYKSRFRINGISVNREQISMLRSLLLDFTLQGDAYNLNNSSRQLHLLDCLDFEKIQQSILDVNKAWKNWSECNFKLQQAQVQINNTKKQFEDMQNIYTDLESLEIEDPNEDEKLEVDQNRLSNLVKLQEGIKSILNRLNESLDEYPSLVDHTNFCINELKILSKIDSSLQIILDNFSLLTNNFYDLTCQIKDYENSLDIDPHFLNDLQFRLSTLKFYQKKYQKTLPELIKYKEDLFESLSCNENSSNIKELISKEKIARLTRDKLNKQLSDIRKEVAITFENKLKIILNKLGLLNVRFQVEFNECEPSISGIDNVNFLFSANPGFPLAPLSDVASGGEKSRVLLAIKAIFASFDDTNLLIFDEIDSGVSGSVSTCIANLLGELSKHRQVFCVTHQPLIAAFADNHFVFKKKVVSGETISTLSNLTEIPDRQKELASLAGGEFVEANAYAASLLEHKAA